MLTATATPRIAIVTHTCFVCGGLSTEEKGLVLEATGYVHATCSDREYQLVTEVSFPDDDPEPEPPTPAVSGPALCEDCRFTHDPFELCEACQELINEWESDRYEPDWDRLYERYLSDRYYGIVAA